MNCGTRASAEESKAEGEEKPEDGKGEPAKKVWTQDSFAAEYRKFNIDMTPKVCKCR